ncbi:insulin-like growth factor-binding protein 3 [Callorhinchus milii]|nr:insulin-like growth factor-binding protein 3 [Callorhinchus milii]
MVYALCVLAVAAVTLKVAASLGPVVRCEPCDSRALGQCRRLVGECEPVREPGCGCCTTCALRQGQPCGVYTERCASGLTCLPQAGETRPLQSLLEGRGVCTNETARHRLPLSSAGNVNNSDEERNASNSRNEWSPNTHRMQDSKPTHPQHIKLLQKEASRKAQLYKINNEAQNTETTNFSSEIKHDTEYGPCRREMEGILNNLKAVSFLSPKGVYIPNCDKNGFYKKKQCRPSKGRRRGICWCVDKYGTRLGSYDRNGELRCYF